MFLSRRRWTAAVVLLTLAATSPRAAPTRSAPVAKRAVARRTSLASLENTRWGPTRIDDQAVHITPKEREPWIELDPKSGRATGSGGCNRISSTYTVKDSTLYFGPIVSTRIACPSMKLETSFLGALKDVRRYRVSGRTLVLMDHWGRVLMRLEERNLH